METNNVKVCVGGRKNTEWRSQLNEITQCQVVLLVVVVVVSVCVSVGLQLG